ncbi:peptidoglycan-binding protein [Evansella sp. LMS18]|uniref:peptidoglycan-binding protein n=1 Tax=Evansella sp. LMS18 TaxID=2924033 RepID=UPI0020D0A04D|nr:peptidoglycan-binding protein [Evansella sp. LMS18]UTR11816.1 peptidoglycan-binding protein [Evansella sp. LMS18]
MKKTLNILLFAVLASFLFTNSSTLAGNHMENVIVVFEEEIDENTLTNLNGKVDQAFKHIPIVSGEMPAQAMKALENNPNVLAVEVDQLVEITNWDMEWGINRIEAPRSWESGLSGKGIKIAVLDTGIAEHPDLPLAGGVSVTSYTDTYFDDHGHGTHVAGIIGAKGNSTVRGIAPEASLYAVKVLNGSGTGYLSDILKGIEWAVNNQMDIINISLGVVNDSISLNQAVDNAYDKGILVVASAGNKGNSDGSGDTVLYPARFNSVIAVSATDINNNRGSFSATGPAIEIAAPGVNILSTDLSNRYSRRSGTSMAAPYVSGVLALMKESAPEQNHVELRKLMQQSAIDIGTAGKDNFFGYGLVQAPTSDGNGNKNAQILKLGDQGEAVLQVNNYLQKLGFLSSSDVSDSFSRKTENSVREFQKYYNIKVSGLVDENTLKRLKDNAVNSPQRGDKSTEIQSLKLDLVRTGFGTHWTNPSTLYGTETVNEVRSFQKYYGLKVNGIMDHITRAKLEEILSSPYQQGNRSGEIQRLKTELQKTGFGTHWSPPTTLYGSETANEVRSFQQYYGLRVNGIMDEITLAKLNEILSSPYQQGKRSREIQQLKIELQKTGFGTHWSPPTTLYGSETANEVRSFQQYYSLRVNGIMDEVTLARLNEILSSPYQQGNRSGKIQQLKLELQKTGFGTHWSPPTTLYGSETTNEVQSFQRYYSLRVNGIMDEVTLAKLDEILSSPYQQGNRSREIQLRKLDLQKAGFGTHWSPPTTFYGLETVNEVKSFQEKHGLAVNGILDEVSLRKLESLIK